MIWETGFFEELSGLLNIRISEYEEQCIDPSAASLDLLQTYTERHSNDENMHSLFSELLAVMSFGNESKLPVYFIF